MTGRTTDSERILLYLVDQMNKHYERELNSFDVNERIKLIEGYNQKTGSRKQAESYAL